MSLVPGLLQLPAGEVRLADRRTQHTWTVQISPFRIGATPVTLDEAVGSQIVDEPALPVVEVSWWDAVRLCNEFSLLEGLPPSYAVNGATETAVWDRGAAGYRLPTEAEWEYACRAGTAGPRYGDLDEIGWYRLNSGERRHPVGLKRANEWGLSDALGNVWEWCWDFYDPDVYGTYRVLKGGGWFDDHWSCRVSVRRRSHPGLRLDDVGFRLARNGYDS